MKTLSVAVAVVLFATFSAWGQTSQSGAAFTVTASDSGNPAEQGPSTWLDAARARHQFFMQARVQNPRQGLPAGTIEGLNVPADSTGSSGSLGGLLDLVGGLTGSSGTLGSLLGSVTGTTGSVTATTGGTSVTGTTGGATLDDLIQLRDALLGNSATNKSLDRAQSAAETVMYETREASGAIGRLPKPDYFMQDVESDRKFVSRWAEAMISTLFTSLTVGFQSRDFVNFLTDALRPILLPDAASTTDGSTDGGSTSDGSTDGSSDGGTDTGGEAGGGIEDLDPSGGGDTGGDSGSVI